MIDAQREKKPEGQGHAHTMNASKGRSDTSWIKNHTMRQSGNSSRGGGNRWAAKSAVFLAKCGDQPQEEVVRGMEHDLPLLLFFLLST
jgi:hypothetical protein